MVKQMRKISVESDLHGYNRDKRKKNSSSLYDKKGIVRNETNVDVDFDELDNSDIENKFANLKDRSSTPKRNYKKYRK